MTYCFYFYAAAPSASITVHLSGGPPAPAGGSITLNPIGFDGINMPNPNPAHDAGCVTVDTPAAITDIALTASSVPLSANVGWQPIQAHYQFNCISVGGVDVVVIVYMP